jgi:3-oxoacid CoA-transferase subunit B
VNGAGRVMVLMDHVSKAGDAKLVTACDLPLTGRGVVSRIITDLAVLDVGGDGFELLELAPGVMVDEVVTKTGAPVVQRRRAVRADADNPVVDAVVGVLDGVFAPQAPSVRASRAGEL